jgi:hypothetical protein
MLKHFDPWRSKDIATPETNDASTAGANFQARQSESARSSDAVTSAPRDKKSNTARYLRPDFRVQGLELLSV